MTDIVLIGLGNPLFSDDGIGIRIIDAFTQCDDIDCVDAGTSGMSVVHALAGRRKAVLVDCARMGEAPGTLRRFTPAEIRSRKALPRLSLHEGDLTEFLELSYTLGEAPESLVLFGIEPACLEFGMALSLVLEARLPEYLQAVSAEIEADNA